MIPVKLRDKVNMIVGKEYDFIYLEHEGKKYICIDCGPIGTDEEVKKAIQLLRAKGFKISDIDD